MNKPKQSDVKKTLVRNPEQPVRKTITVTKSKEPAKCKTEESKTLLRRGSKTDILKDNDKTKNVFNTPEMYSTLKLSKKIDEVVKPRKTKSLSDVDKNKLAVDEKVTRKVNFPYGQSVFRDLIPLTNNEVKSQPVVASRGPILQRDKEPVLTDFLEPRRHKIYYHSPSCATKTFDERISVPANSGLGLYKMRDQDQTNEMLKLCLQKICELQAEIEQGETSVADPEAEGYTACAMETLRFLSDQGLRADHPVVQALTERLTRSRD